jgi:hypothetical protein
MGMAGQPLRFSGSVKGGIAPFTYRWSWGDGTTATGNQNPEHRYSKAGNYTVAFSVLDARGRLATGTTSVRVKELRRTMVAHGPYSTRQGVPIRFKATLAGEDRTGLPDPEYVWDFGDGSNAKGPNLSHDYSLPGTYVVNLMSIEKGRETGHATTFATVSPRNQNRATIDKKWVEKHGSGCYVLDKADTVYTLATDVTTPGTAFVVGAANVTLDLNGHTVTHGDSSPITVKNGGFEEGAGRDVPGWDLRKAPSAAIAPNKGFMWGKQVLRLSNLTKSERIVSDPIPVPAAGHTYVATITPAHGDWRTKATLSVIDAITGKVLAAGDSDSVERGFSAVVRFVPSTTNPVKLQLDVAPPPGKAETVDLDYAALMPSDDYGVLASSLWQGEIPGYVNLTSQAQAAYAQAANFTIRNGRIRQGKAQGYSCPPLFLKSAKAGFLIDGVEIEVHGMDTPSLDAHRAGGSMVVRNSTFSENVDNISNRMHVPATVYFAQTQGPILIDNNRLLGCPQAGIALNGNDPRHRVTIIHNRICQKAIVTNAYGIVLDPLENFEIAFNRITPIDGRGISVDGFAPEPVANGEIHDNYVSVQEGFNREYTTGGAARALRLRNTVDSKGPHRNLRIYNNTFIAITGPGLVPEAYGALINYVNHNSAMNDAHIILNDNIFKAIVSSPDPDCHAAALDIDGMEPGIGLEVANNVFESNEASLRIGGSDGFSVSDIALDSNTFRKSSDGVDRPYTDVIAGYWTGAIKDVWLTDARFQNDGKPLFTWSGSAAKEIVLRDRIALIAQSPRGDFLPGCVVNLADKDGRPVFSGTTAADGQLPGIPLVTAVYRQPTPDPKLISMTVKGPFTARLHSGLANESRVIDVSKARIVLLTAQPH